MSDGHFPTLISKDRDVNSSSNPIFETLVDAGGDQIAINADGSLNLGSIIPGTGATNLGKAEDAVHASGDTGVMALAVRKDAGGTLAGSDGDYAPLQVNAQGELVVTTGAGSSIADDSPFNVGVDKVSGSGFLADESGSGAPDLVNEGDIGIARMTLDRKQLMVLVDSTNDARRLVIDAGGRITVNVNGTVTVTATDLDIRDLVFATDKVDVSGSAVSITGSVTVVATDLDIRDLNLTQDAVRVSGNSSANSQTNPIFVQVVQSALSSSEVHSYNTASSVASDTASNHDYTVTGTTFLLKQIIVSSSGGCKIEVQTGPIGSLTTVFVGFIPKEGGTRDVTFAVVKEVPSTSTGTVRVIRTNRQGQSQDLYSTIIGNDIP